MSILTPYCMKSLNFKIFPLSLAREVLKLYSVTSNVKNSTISQLFKAIIGDFYCNAKVTVEMCNDDPGLKVE